VHDCQSLPGQELFQYLDDEGNACAVRSEDVNGYIREAAGEDFTAKDFRTGKRTTETVIAIEKAGPAANETEAKKNICEPIKSVSQTLQNRPATCRAYYVHPAILDSYTNGTFFDIIRRAINVAS
jgi:DNA topoisomerase-1